MISFLKYISFNSNSVTEQTEKIRFGLTWLFVFTLPFDIFYSSIILILLFTLTVLDISLSKFKSIPKQIWVFQIAYLLSIAGYFYSFNKHEAGFLLERQLAILFFPVILPLAFTINNERKKDLLSALTTSCLLSVLYLFGNVLYILHIGKLPIHYLFSKEFFNHQFSAPLNIHAGYLSLYISISVFCLLEKLVTKISKLKKVIVGFLMFILLGGLFFLAARNTIITTILIVSLIFPLIYIKRKILFITITLSSFAITVLFIKNVNYLNERFFSELVNDINIQKTNTTTYEDVEPRIDRWVCALELIKQSPIIGYGTGDEILMLKTKYAEKSYFISYLESFNAHNQYLSYFLKNGIIGLIAFLGSLLYYLLLGIKKRDFIYISFLVLLMIGFLTENILDANKGIFFFALFNTFFGYNILIDGKQFSKPELSNFRNL